MSVWGWAAWCVLGVVGGATLGSVLWLAVALGKLRQEQRTVLVAVLSLKKSLDPAWAARWEANLAESQRRRSRDG